MRFFKKKISSLSGNTPKRYSVYRRRQQPKLTGLIVVGVFVGFFGLFTALHASGMNSYAQTKFSGFVSKFVKTQQPADLNQSTKSDTSCLSAATFDPKKCKRYGSTETY